MKYRSFSSIYTSEDNAKESWKISTPAMTVTIEVRPENTVLSSESLYAGTCHDSSLPETLESAVTEASETTAVPHIHGLVDPIYYIENVVDFHPRKGYLVHWKNYPESDRTWQRPRDMPQEFRDQMKAVKGRFNELHAHRGGSSPLISAETVPASVKRKASPVKAASAPAPLSKKAKESPAVDPAAKARKIRTILEYKRGQGYLVSWVGKSSSHNSWVLKSQMPREAKPLVTAFHEAEEPSDSETDESEDYEIDQVLQYDPKQGFLVSWVGYGQDMNSWQLEADMPSSLFRQMEELKKQFRGKGNKSIANLPRPATPQPAALLIRTPSPTDPSDVHVLHSVLKYDPRMGYLVHWQGRPEFYDSWISEDQISSGYRYQAMLARERYEDNAADRSGPSAQ